MDEVIVAVARSVACPTRLRILSCLARTAERAPTALADDLRVPLAQLCIHLRRLASAGLISRRRSGTWCYCQSRSPYGPQAFSGKLARWLYEALKNPAATLQACRGQGAGRRSRTSDEAALHRIVFQAATAFTHPRRLQLLRRLRVGAADVLTLTQELRMSPTALCRHMAKLERRGYVTTHRDGRLLTYQLASKFTTPMHARWFAIVCAARHPGPRTASRGKATPEA